MKKPKTNNTETNILKICYSALCKNLKVYANKKNKEFTHYTSLTSQHIIVINDDFSECFIERRTRKTYDDDNVTTVIIPLVKKDTIIDDTCGIVLCSISTFASVNRTTRHSKVYDNLIQLLERYVFSESDDKSILLKSAINKVLLQNHEFHLTWKRECKQNVSDLLLNDILLNTL